MATTTVLPTVSPLPVRTAASPHPSRSGARPGGRSGREVVVIGHRGAPGHRPEHTLAGYELAIAMGADALEPDLVATSDGVLLARHENEISGTTDVARRPEFAHKRRTQVVDGHRVTGWFVEDFTLAEVKTLWATERLGGLRPANRQHDDQHRLVTLDEVLLLVRRARRRTGRPIGLYLELKHAHHLARRGLHLDRLLLDTLGRHDMLDPAGDGAGVWVESFEVDVLRRLARQCDLPLVQLLETEGCPPDRGATGPSYVEMTRPEALAEIATYARAVGAHKDLVIPRSPLDGRLGRPSALVGDAHAAGLAVVVYTLRAENRFLPTDLRRGTDPAAHGDLAGELRAHVAAGVDGVFTDFPDLALAPGSVLVSEHPHEHPRQQPQRAAG